MGVARCSTWMKLAEKRLCMPQIRFLCLLSLLGMDEAMPPGRESL